MNVWLYAMIKHSGSLERLNLVIQDLECLLFWLPSHLCDLDFKVKDLGSTAGAV